MSLDILLEHLGGAVNSRYQMKLEIHHGWNAIFGNNGIIFFAGIDNIYILNRVSGAASFSRLTLSSHFLPLDKSDQVIELPASGRVACPTDCVPSSESVWHEKG